MMMKTKRLIIFLITLINITSKVVGNGNPVAYQKIKLSQLESLISGLQAKEDEDEEKTTFTSFAEVKAKAASRVRASEMDMYQLEKMSLQYEREDDKKAREEMELAKKDFEGKVKHCDGEPNRNQCVESTLRKKKWEIMDEMDGLVPEFDKLCVRDSKHCLRMTKKSCREFGCGLCAGGQALDLTNKCIEDCPTFKKLMQEDIRCRKKCHDCEEEKKLCLKNYASNERRYIICDKPCHPCLDCTHPKTKRVKMCHKDCKTKGRVFKYERRCKRQKEGLDMFCRLCSLSPRCKSNHICKECKGCRKFKRKIARCGEKLKRSLRKYIKYYCKSQCRVCGKVDPFTNEEYHCPEKCKKRCKGKKVRKTQRDKEVLEKLMDLGLYRSEEAMLDKLRNKEALKAEDHKSEIKKFKKRGKKVKKKLDDLVADLTKMESKKANLAKNIKKFEEKLRVLTRSFKRDVRTGASRATLDKEKDELKVIKDDRLKGMISSLESLDKKIKKMRRKENVKKNQLENINKVLKEEEERVAVWDRKVKRLDDLGKKGKKAEKGRRE